MKYAQSDFKPQRLVISHGSDCPVAQPDFKPPTIFDERIGEGIIDPNAPSQCTCDFGERMRAVLLSDAE